LQDAREKLAQAISKIEDRSGSSTQGTVYQRLAMPPIDLIEVQDPVTRKWRRIKSIVSPAYVALKNREKTVDHFVPEDNCISGEVEGVGEGNENFNNVEKENDDFVVKESDVVPFLVSVAKPAGFGDLKTNSTKHDTSVRSALEIGSDQFLVSEDFKGCVLI
jgi:hypothetical protein